MPELARELGCSEKEIKSVLDIYWDKVRKALSSLDNNRLYLKGLGTFYVKPWAVDKKIAYNEAVLRKYSDNPTPKSLSIVNQVSKDNLKLQIVKQREHEYGLIRNYKRNERYNQDLEGKGQDS